MINTVLLNSVAKGDINKRDPLGEIHFCSFATICWTLIGKDGLSSNF